MRYPRVLLTVVAPLILPWNVDPRFMLSPIVMMVGSLVFFLSVYTVSGALTAMAIAHINAHSSRAIAVVINCVALPLASNRL